MGIRFEYGSRRATNGPVIFFTDPISEGNLKEEIRGAVESRLSFYAYRMPGDMMMTFGSSEMIVQGIGEPGFVIAPFDPEAPALTIPYKPVANRQDRPEIPKVPYTPPLHTTTPAQHAEEVAHIQKTLLETGHGKIVAAKVCVEEGSMDLGATFISLSKAYPDAFIYCFGSPQTGCWIGASPELLLKGSVDKMTTMALAGTRGIGDDGPWDEKNMEEQQMVTDYITDCLRQHRFKVSAEMPQTRNAGAIEHLCSPIEAITPTSFTLPDFTALLHDLSPTPALCGLPRPLALKVIKSSEEFERGYYGGFCGPFHSLSDFTFYVSIRCANVRSSRFAIYAGGGITAQSRPAEEWKETEMKTLTLKKYIEFQ